MLRSLAGALRVRPLVWRAQASGVSKFWTSAGHVVRVLHGRVGALRREATRFAPVGRHATTGEVLL